MRVKLRLLCILSILNCQRCHLPMELKINVQKTLHSFDPARRLSWRADLLSWKSGNPAKPRLGLYLGAITFHAWTLVDNFWEFTSHVWYRSQSRTWSILCGRRITSGDSRIWWIQRPNYVSVHRKARGDKEPEPIKKRTFTGASNFMERPPSEPPNLPMVTSGEKASNPQLPRILSTMPVKDSGMYS